MPPPDADICSGPPPARTAPKAPGERLPRVAPRGQMRLPYKHVGKQAGEYAGKHAGAAFNRLRTGGSSKGL